MLLYRTDGGPARRVSGAGGNARARPDAGRPPEWLDPPQPGRGAREASQRMRQRGSVGRPPRARV
eukprot:484404-Lingulodinium_polyedra.AAC.1